MNKKRVIVLMGGKSPEHDVSLVTGREVVRNLDKRKYEVLPVIISRDGNKWQLKSINEVLRLSPAGVGKSIQRQRLGASRALSINSLISQRLPIKPDSRKETVVFIAMHGPFGEDGTVQGLLELTGFPYTGAGVLASALGMDKIMFYKIMEREKVPVGKYLVVDQQTPQTRTSKDFSFPFVVKPSDQGSSVGVSIVHKQKELKQALKLAFDYSNPIIVQEYLKGTEVSCGVLGNNNPVALPVAEIRPKKEFFDYEAKYQPEMCEEIVPANISKKLTQEVQDLAIKVYETIGCRGFGRIDMIIQKDKAYVLEINTIPGLTPNSLLPQEAQTAGISYSQLLDKIITYSLEK